MGIRALNNGLNGFRTLKYGVLDEQEKSSETKASPTQILPSSSSTNLNYKEEKAKKEESKESEEEDTPSESENNYIGQGEWEDDEPSYTTIATDEEAAYDDGSITV